MLPQEHNSANKSCRIVSLLVCLLFQLSYTKVKYNNNPKLLMGQLLMPKLLLGMLTGKTVPWLLAALVGRFNLG